MGLALQFLGALGILVPFALFQAGKVSQHGYLYLTLNFAGAGILTALAVLDRQWGFVILQGAWTLVALVGMVRHRGSRRTCPS
jgi:hypothetical protein